MMMEPHGSRLKDSPDRSGIGGDSLDVSANFSSESFGQHVFNIQFFPSFGTSLNRGGNGLCNRSLWNSSGRAELSDLVLGNLMKAFAPTELQCELVSRDCTESLRRGRRPERALVFFRPCTGLTSS